MGYRASVGIRKKADIKRTLSNIAQLVGYSDIFAANTIAKHQFSGKSQAFNMDVDLPLAQMVGSIPNLGSRGPLIVSQMEGYGLGGDLRSVLAYREGRLTFTVNEHVTSPDAIAVLRTVLEYVLKVSKESPKIGSIPLGRLGDRVDSLLRAQPGIETYEGHGFGPVKTLSLAEHGFVAPYGDSAIYIDGIGNAAVIVGPPSIGKTDVLKTLETSRTIVRLSEGLALIDVFNRGVANTGYGINGGSSAIGGMLANQTTVYPLSGVVYLHPEGTPAPDAKAVFQTMFVDGKESRRPALFSSLGAVYPPAVQAAVEALRQTNLYCVSVPKQGSVLDTAQKVVRGFEQFDR